MTPSSPRNKRKQDDTAAVVSPKKFLVLVEGDVPDSDSVEHELCLSVHERCGAEMECC